MRSTTVLLATVATCVAAANDNAWLAPTASDRRSPCPMLNALANQGLIARDGLNISLSDLSTVLLDVVGLDPAATAIVGAAGLKASTTGYADTLNLDDLNKHGVIEHDGSLSRADYNGGAGDNHSFDPEVWANTLAHYPDETISLEQAAKARAAAVARSKATNPTFTFGASQLQVSLLESSLIQAVFGSPTEGNAVLKHVRVLFEEARLPIAEGWVKQKSPITVAQLLGLANKLSTIPV